MSFGFVLREIQAFKVSILVLKSIPFESDNFVVNINRAKILNKYRRHIFNVSPKILRILELLKASCKPFCVQVHLEVILRK
jgi:hypothetical protein